MSNMRVFKLSILLLDQEIVISSTVAKTIERSVSKCLPCTHRELSSILSIHVKNPGAILSLQSQRLGDRASQIPASFCVDNPTISVSSMLVRNPIARIKMVLIEE